MEQSDVKTLISYCTTSELSHGNTGPWGGMHATETFGTQNCFLDHHMSQFPRDNIYKGEENSVRFLTTFLIRKYDF